MTARKNPQVDRYQLVALRGRIKSLLLQDDTLGYVRAYNILADLNRLPKRSNGELLDISGFASHFRTVKDDMNHSFSPLAISFLYRACRDSMYDKDKCNGMRYLAWVTGLHEVTIKDILILNGEIR